MGFMTSIINALHSVSSWFSQLFLNCYYAGWPLNSIASWFYSLCTVFNTLAWQFYYLSNWVSDVASKVANILSWSTIWSYILSFIPNLIAIRDWFYGWWNNIWNEVGTWWDTTKPLVQGWIAVATEGLHYLNVMWSNFWTITWPQWTTKLDTVKANWDYFWSITFPTLVSFTWLTTWWSSRLTDIQNLINSAFLIRRSFWEGWQDIRVQVVEFFSDPEEWLYKATDRIIERFW